MNRQHTFNNLIIFNLMKKFLLQFSVFMFAALHANAQLTVYADGKVGIATEDSTAPISVFSVNRGEEGYDLSVIGTKRGIYGQSNGQYLDWAHGLYGYSNCPSASFQNGVSGIAVIASPQYSCRTYGVMGIAGNATPGWNYGVYGQLNGENYGAGVYGTSTSGENGVYLDNRYAGYFNGPTKVNGGLNVTGFIMGKVINPISTGNSISKISYKYQKSSLSDKLSMLSATCYYEEVADNKQSAMKSTADTICAAAPVNEMQKLSADRVHYGLDVEQLKEAFPELVYEQENGEVGVNYMELIPILIQAINNLNAEVKSLKENISSPYTDSSTSTNNAIILNTDGKVIGTKRVVSK